MRIAHGQLASVTKLDALPFSDLGNCAYCTMFFPQHSHFLIFLNSSLYLLPYLTLPFSIPPPPAMYLPSVSLAISTFPLSPLLSSFLCSTPLELNISPPCVSHSLPNLHPSLTPCLPPTPPYTTPLPLAVCFIHRIWLAECRQIIILLPMGC